jgi:hypothetical protein
LSILTKEHEEEVWGQSIEQIEEAIDDILDGMGEEHPLYEHVLGLKVHLGPIDKAHEQCMESSFDRGSFAGKAAAVEMEREAHKQVSDVVSRWMPRVRQFCERVKTYLGPERLDESHAVHDLRNDIHDIPRGWV